MRAQFNGRPKIAMLYKEYLRNFVINTELNV
jgi:hypothetical protein